MEPLNRMRSWLPPSDWLTITTMETHTEGEPLRIITSGIPEIPGRSVLEKRRYFMENLDHLRRALILEPRGHADMYGAVITEPSSREAHFGVIFMHNEGYSTGCGHAVIALAKVAVLTGIVEATEPQTEVRIETPSGLVRAFVEVRSGRVGRVKFQNVPSFVYALDNEVEVEEIGRMRYDVAFGGAFYAFVNAEDLGLRCVPDNYRRIIDLGMKIKRAVMRSLEVKHPFEEDLSFLYGTIFICPPEEEGSHSRQVTVFAEGEVDRCPTGTGVSARLPLLLARGEVRVGEELIFESIINTRFTGEIVEVTRYGPYDAVIPEIGGDAHVIAKNTFLLDPEDPLKYGFFLR
ncbi:MAG: proline racemase family protein [Candidatus Korarchaeum sp.]|nr:proline racemase family protein [Candidatus Korarchaeum sp.]MDW8036128.1 proline racemase family protein [Candidatus Korarchaeum sp.]